MDVGAPLFSAGTRYLREVSRQYSMLFLERIQMSH